MVCFCVFFEPTDMRIADRPYSRSPQLAALARQTVKFTSPNLYELRQLARALQYPGPIGTTTLEAYSTVHDLLADLKPLGAHVNRTIENVLVTLGQYGVAVFRRCPETVPFFDTDGQYLRQPAATSCARFYAGRKQTQIVNVSGAGDSFTSGFIVAAIAGRTEGGCVAVAFEAAGCALRSRGAVAERYFDAAHPCWTDATGATYHSEPTASVS
uniref:Carbohydrate kinase PfkB domain-containing protein n=1 Tax=Anopheles atroparvus TaxID=41427 RepID=A0A182IRL6_ANOAO